MTTLISKWYYAGEGHEYILKRLKEVTYNGNCKRVSKKIRWSGKDIENPYFLKGFAMKIKDSCNLILRKRRTAHCVQR